MRKLALILLIFVLCASFTYANGLRDNEICHYSFDDANLTGASDPIDEADFCGNADNVGATTGGAGILGEAFDFGNDYVASNLTSEITITTGGIEELTFSVWHKTDAITGDDYVLGTSPAGSADRLHALYISGSEYHSLLLGGAVAVHDCDSNVPANVGHWNMFTLVINTTGTYQYINGTLRQSCAKTWVNPINVAAAQMMFIGARNQAGSADNHFDGMIDQFVVWNESLSDAKITSLWNSGSGLARSAWTSASDTFASEIDLLFANNSGTYATSFREGESFQSYVNWTDASDGTALNNTVGSCNITLINVTLPTKSVEPEFTLCDNAMCTYATYNESFTGLETINVIENSVHFDVCHTNVEFNDLIVNLSCTGGSYQETVPQAAFPRCLNGNATIFVNTSICSNNATINVSFTNAANLLQQSHTISSIELDILVSEDVNNNSEMTFNDTLQLWQTVHEHQYYAHGTSTIFANCSHSTNSDFDNSTIETITIVNTPPQIFLEFVRTGNGDFNLTNNMVIEYTSGEWHWGIAVIDDDVDTINITWYNTTHGIESIQGTLATVDFNTSDQTFLEFDTLYSVNVTVNDTAGAITTSSLNFLLNDTLDPVITWTSPTDDNLTRQLDDRVFCFDITVEDEGLYSINVNSSKDGFTTVLHTNLTTGLSPTSHQHQQCVNYTGNGTGTYEVWARVCDGHTNNKINDFYSGKDNVKEALLFDNNNLVVYSKTSGVLSFDAVKQYDRYEFEYNYNGNLNQLVFGIASNNPIDYVVSDYKGHFVVDNKFWVDFEEFDANSVSIKPDSFDNYTNAYEITINFKVSKDKFKFKSVGELNCVTETVQFQLQDTPPPLNNLTDIFSCGEKLLDTNITFNLGGDLTQGCVLRNNEYFIAQNQTNCTINSTIDYFYGKNTLNLVYDNGTTQSCTIWKEKIEKSIADYLLYFLYAFILTLILGLGIILRSAWILLFGGLVCVFMTLLFYGLSGWLAVIVFGVGALIIIVAISDFSKIT